MDSFKHPDAAVAESIAKEAEEVDALYVEGLHLAKAQGAGLAAYAFNDARRAESVHLQLFKEAQALLSAGKDIPLKAFHTCTSCGYTVAAEAVTEHCPVCGAPSDKFCVVEG